MKPKLVVAAVAVGFSLSFMVSAADAATQEIRHIAMMLVAQAANEAFARVDEDRDGRIDRQEAARDPKIEAVFDRIDTDGNGLISPEEWVAYRQHPDPVALGRSVRR